MAYVSHHSKRLSPSSDCCWGTFPWSYDLIGKLIPAPAWLFRAFFPASFGHSASHTHLVLPVHTLILEGLCIEMGKKEQKGGRRGS